ncbi:disks large-associated protein 5 isoform X1 [Channa argus]|uniref:disks large-associated protein 5 isoform X1 n=1 Tax=Channa argus TaxID=215402 RepID=UPI003522938A
MESRFTHLRQRDTSVSMLRVKMSRRRSQSQKENRERAMNTRRQLDKLPELEMSSMDASILMANMSTIQEKTQNNAKPAKSLAVEDRLKQLERWKERKALEKEKKERERKGIFKTGLYHPKDTLTIVTLPVVPAAPKRAKETKVNIAPSQNTRVTRSMKQQLQVQKCLKTQDSNAAAKKAQPAVERSTKSLIAPVKPAQSATKTTVCTAEPALRALSTRSTNRPPVTAVPVVKDKPKDKAADTRITRSRVIGKPVAPPSGRERSSKASAGNTAQPPIPMEPELKEYEMQKLDEKPHPPSLTSCSKEEDMVMDQPQADSVSPVDTFEAPNSFAPEGFVFQAPAGLLNFKFEPLTPRSADAFLTPSSSISLPPVPVFSAEPNEPTSGSPHHYPAHTFPTVAPLTPGSPLESNHDVPYFRAEIVNETERLTGLCVHWESKVEDESIPEEMRDHMRTAIGQARLLMKERFNQFSGLVDDCELGRGEKITTCTDLQGFWDMVYYQVEDVQKKFNALKEAEGRGWIEEHKPPSRQRKVVKKLSAPPAKPTIAKAAVKSRLAAVKAAMKAKQQAAKAEQAAQNADSTQDNTCTNSQEPQYQAEAQIPETVVFDGGFFKVESPAKALGSVRRSSRLSAAMLPQASPCSKSLTPRRVTRQFLALEQTPVQGVASPAQPVFTPAHLHLTLKQTPAQAPQSHRGTPKSTRKTKDTINVSLCFSPVKEILSDDVQPDRSSVQQSESVSPQDSTTSVPQLGTPKPVDSQVVEEQGEPANAVNLDVSLSPRLSHYPCKTPPPSSQVPEPSSSLSFTLSPCMSPSQPIISSITAVEAQGSVCCTPDSSVVEEIPGLDIERYLLPSQRCSLSPRETVSIQTLSPLPVDVEMESPGGPSGDLLSQQEPALPVVSSVLTLQSPQVHTTESALLLFTPDLTDRIRQSVCPSDLMVFTPPTNV